MTVKKILDYVIKNHDETFSCPSDFLDTLDKLSLKEPNVINDYNKYVKKSHNVLLPNSFDELYNYYLLVKENNKYNIGAHNMYLALMMYYYH